MTGEKMKGFFNSLTPKQQEAALAYDGPENFGFPMTGENTAPAEMPGVEEIARVVTAHVWNDDDGQSAARAILALFAKILAEKERKIVALQQRFDEKNDAIGSACVRLAAAEAALAAERAQNEAYRQNRHYVMGFNAGFEEACQQGLGAAAIRSGE